MKSKVMVVAAVVFILLSLACERQKNGLGPNDDPEAPQDIVYTHQDSVEAYDLALYLTGELTAPPEWVSKLLYDLKYLRFRYIDQYEVVFCMYFLPWSAGEISCKVDSLTAVQICNHKYSYWEQLPAEIRPDSIKNYPHLKPLLRRYVTIAIPKQYHPERVAEYYEQLPGFHSCRASYKSFSYALWVPSIDFYPGLPENGDVSWLYIANGFDKIACVTYFKTIEGKPVFIGEWAGEYSDEPEPDWWPEAKLNMSVYD